MCKVKRHRSHRNSPLLLLCKNLKDELGQFYKSSTAPEELLSKINNLKLIQDNLTQNKSDFHRQFNNVTRQLNVIYQSYKSKLESELEYFYAERCRLENLRRIQEKNNPPIE